MVQPDRRRELALNQAATILNCAADLLAETDDADLRLPHTLNRAALHFIDASKALINASAHEA